MNLQTCLINKADDLQNISCNTHCEICKLTYNTTNKELPQKWPEKLRFSILPTIKNMHETKVTNSICQIPHK